jgi:hypothetical protein
VLTSLGGPWDTVPATGVKAARRPTPARLEQLLEPAPHLRISSENERISHAYRSAFRLAFDDEGKRLADSGNGELLQTLGRRRSGRPLGLAA